MNAQDASPQEGLTVPSRRRPTWQRVFRLALKELREILRDRRTIITLVLMPLLVYPLLSILFQRFLVFSAPLDDERQMLVVGVESDATDEVDRRTDVFWQFLGSRDSDKRFPELELQNDVGDEVTVELRQEADINARVADGTLDLGVRVELLGDSRRPQLAVETVFRESSARSREALATVQQRLSDENQRLLLGPFRSPPIKTTRTKVEPSDETPTVSLQTVFPLILILMTITGAVYPAIDLTAGERERGTMETLIAAPVPRFSLLLAKYCAVMTVALMTASVNMIAMTITILSTGMGQLLFAEGLSVLAVVQLFGLMVLFASFFSAVLLALTSFARSFKEAQAYLIPVMLISIAPGLLCLLPDVELSGVLVVTPLVNIVLLGRDMFKGQADGVLAIMVVLSTALYALAAIAVAARIFGTDAILYGSQSSWSDLLRRPADKRTTASVTGAMLCLATLFPLFFLLQNIVAQQRDWIPVAGQLAINAALTITLFGVLPLTAAAVNNVALGTGFRLLPAPLLAFIGAALLGLVLWPFAHEAFLLGQWLGLASLTGDQIKAAQRLLEVFADIPLVLILFTIAVIAPVCEEFFFRGYLLSALRRQISAHWAILFSALLFGLFHVVQSNGLAAERLLPSALMGVFLGWVCLQTGSVFPGMLLHVCHNGLLLLMARYRHQLADLGLGLESEATHMPWPWLLGALLAVAAAVWLLLAAGKREQAEQASAGRDE